MNATEPSPLTQKLIKDINRLDDKSNTSSLFHDYVFNSIRRRLKIEGDISEKDKKFLIYAGVLKSIFNFSQKFSVHQALQHLDTTEEKEVELLVNSSAFKKICLFCRNRKLPYLIINNILEHKRKDLKKLLADPQKIEKEIEGIYETRKKRTEEKTYRQIALAAITAFLIAFFSFWRLTDFSSSLKILLVATPPFLASLLVFNFPSPSAGNRRRAVFETLEILYKKKEEFSYCITFEKKKKQTVRLMVNVFYALGFFIFLMLLLWLFDVAGIPPFPSSVMVVLFIFISLVGIKAKETIADIYLTERKESFVDIVMDFFAFPVIKTRGFSLIRKKKSAAQPPRPFQKKRSIIQPPRPPKKPRKSFSLLVEGWVEKLRKMKEKIYED